MQTMSGIRGFSQEPNSNPNPNPNTNSNPVVKKKRNLPGTPDPDAEVIALSPKTLMATNRFVCEICNKGFQRDQNLQLHRRGHNLPWKLKQRTSKEIKKKVYICPEKSCVHHDPSRALGDLTGIKKHFSRKHGEKKWKCEKCSKKYAVQSDWKAHSKTCGTREYKCDCGTLFSRKDSFITHRAFCDALAEESARFTSVTPTNLNFRTDSISDTTCNPQSTSLPHGFGIRGGAQDEASLLQFSSIFRPDFPGQHHTGPLDSDGPKPRLSLWMDQPNSQLNHTPIDVSANSEAFLSANSSSLTDLVQMASSNLFGSSSMVDFGGCISSNWINRCAGASAGANLTLSTSPPRGLNNKEGNKGNMVESLAASLYSSNQNQQHNPLSNMSATALLQKAAQMGSTRSDPSFINTGGGGSFGLVSSSSINPNSQNRNEFHQLFQQSKQHESLNDLMNKISSSTTTTSTTTMGDGILGGLNLTDTANNLNRLMMPRNSDQIQSVQLKLHPSGSGVEHSLTRDFLGVGSDASRPFLQQELEKFASMGSAMDLTHYRDSH